MGKQTSGFSLRTKDATKGGGIEGALATIREIQFVDEFTYGGRQKDKPQAALRVEYGVEGFDKPWEQHYTLGPSEKYEVIADGDSIKSAGKQKGLNENCSAFKFFEALETAAGESDVDLEELLPDVEDEDGCQSIRPLEGRTVRLTNVKFETVGGDVKDLPVIASFEDDAPAPKGKSAGKGKVDIEAATVAAIESLLEDNTSIKRSDISNLIYQNNKKDPNVKAMMELAFKDNFIADEDRPWTFDKKKGVIRAAD